MKELRESEHTQADDDFPLAYARATQRTLRLADGPMKCTTMQLRGLSSVATGNSDCLIEDGRSELGCERPAPGLNDQLRACCQVDQPSFIHLAVADSRNSFERKKPWLLG
jgi:hypothetical protein